jgi:ABC-type glycerol-3-phosphate transport system substrate-binding protein
MKLIRILVLAGMLALLLAGCGGQSSGAALAVEDYFKALVAKDGARLVTLSCAAWESTATIELDSFVSVETSLQNIQCQAAGQEGDVTLVACTGQIIASYDGEDQTLELSDRTYLAVQEGGEWRMCGYK